MKALGLAILAIAIGGVIGYSSLFWADGPISPVATYSLPDGPDGGDPLDGVPIYTNASPESKTVTLTPTSKDKTFQVQVQEWNEETEEWEDWGTSMEFHDGHTPPITVGPGRRIVGSDVDAASPANTRKPEGNISVQ